MKHTSTFQNLPLKCHSLQNGKVANKLNIVNVWYFTYKQMDWFWNFSYEIQVHCEDQFDFEILIHTQSHWQAMRHIGLLHRNTQK